MTPELIVAVIITIAIILLVVYMIVNSKQPEKMRGVSTLVAANLQGITGPAEHMISEQQIEQISRGFNMPYSKDYPELMILSEAESAGHIADINLD
jgi:hypothetical protein